ncbi:type II toxin-antitoxin system YafQ family toxin [Comamonadaceae bacterium G21597-S1]|nr:type II toxin-antitoxin system YafQ family toxin [Comamonadaceae bacterium G21597-S1]
MEREQPEGFGLYRCGSGGQHDLGVRADVGVGDVVGQRTQVLEQRPDLLSAGRPTHLAPGPEWLDHPLKGDWHDHRECHIGGDFLLIYRLEGTTIIFVRAGSHSELFED